MKFLVGFLLMLAAFAAAQTQESLVDTSRYFEFHSNTWINLHHFLYEKAQGGQLEHLQEDGNTFLDIGEDSVFAHLNQTDSDDINAAITYYRDHLIDRSLFQLGDLRVWLQEQDPDKAISDTTFSKALTDILNIASTVYRPKFWPLHDAQNRKVLASHIGTVRQLEDAIIGKMEGLSGDVWPDTRVRVDLTVYANWAGAYTPVQPNMNIFISTLDPFSPSSQFIETVFHEGAHLLFSRRSPFRARIYLMSQDLEMDFPRDLWHASQFYLTGRVVQDALSEVGIDHELVMDMKNIFSDYNTADFRATLERYYQGKADMETTIETLLLNPK